jgi:polysaccharide export outer membrane protein
LSAWRRAFWVLTLVCVPVVAGCYTLGTEVSSQALPNLNDPLGAPRVPPEVAPPRELAKMSLPVYRIEPPDVVQVEMLKAVPLPPYRLGVYDALAVNVRGTLLDAPITSNPKEGGSLRIVDANGEIDLGAPYGKVRVAGMTIDEAREAITNHLKAVLKYPEVSLQLAQGSPIQPVNGQYRVEPDGTINLRHYGTVRIAGMTAVEAKLSLDKHLAQYFDSPDVSVSVTGFNSKFYYIITQGAGQGDKVVKLQATGNETVLDAIAQIGGLSQLSSNDIWIARPAPARFGCEQILPIDWDAITKGGMTATNYQILPGDRVYIAEDETLAWTNLISKVTGPIERVVGIAGLGASTVRNFQNLGRGAGAGFGGYGGFGF